VSTKPLASANDSSKLLTNRNKAARFVRRTLIT